jgi:recombination protein RecA
MVLRSASEVCESIQHFETEPSEAEGLPLRSLAGARRATSMATSLLNGISRPSTHVGPPTRAREAVEAIPRFCLAELAGRLVELSGDGASAVLTAATKLMADAQATGEPVAWVGIDESSFYPPDVAESGVSLATLVVVRIPLSSPTHPSKRSRSTLLAVAAERLLRSGAFGLVLLDLGQAPELSQPLQSRLLGLAQHHQAAVLCLTEKSETAASLGSLVSLRAHVGRTWLGGERFECELRVSKDKRHGPVWSEREVCRGPMGLR